MKKLVIIVVIILFCVVGWAGATYVVGSKVEDQYFNLLQQNSHWGPITLTSKSYQRGFFNSKAEMLLEIKVPQMPVEEGEEPTMETVELVFEHTLHHGPLPIVDGRVSFSPALALVDTRMLLFSPEDQALEELLQNIPELKESFLHLRLGFDGSTNGKIEIPPFEKHEEGVEFVWGGFIATTDYAPGAGTLVGTLDMPKVEIHFDDGTLSWSGIRGDFDLVETLPMLFVGTTQMVSGGMELAFVEKGGDEEDSEERTVLQLQGFKAVTDSSFDGQLVQVTQNMTFDGASFDGESYGPLVFDMELKNMDGHAFSDYQVKVMDLYREADIYDQDALLAELLPLYTDLAMAMMTGSPEFNINRFYVNTPMGEADGTFKLKLDNLPGEAPDNLAAIFGYLQYLESSAELSVDESLLRALLASNIKSSLELELEGVRESGVEVEMSDAEIDVMVEQQLGEQLEIYIAQNLIVRDGDKIRSNASFNGGQLLVNGQVLPLFGQ